ncbi:cytochrome P450 [Kitasatospora sp. NPDC001095]
MTKPPAGSTTGTAQVTGAIPRAAGGLPLLGHTVPLLRDPLRFFTGLPAQGDLVQIRLGPLRAFVVCDAALTAQLLREDQSFDKGGPFYDRAREVAGNGLVSCPHSEHRRQRRLLQPAFHPTRLPGYAQAATAQSAAMTGAWQDGQSLDVLAAMQDLTAKVTIGTLFSSTPPPDVLAQALGHLNTLLRTVTGRMLTPPPLDRLPTPGNRRYHQARSALPSVFEHIVTDRQDAATDHGDLVSMLLTAYDPDSGPGDQRLADAEIIDQIITFFLVGTETSATALAWALHLLAQHPEIEKQLHAEVDTVLGGRPATHADLPHLELTARVITETLRLWPPAWFFTRTCAADARLGRHQVRAGTILLYSPFLLHRQADLYPDPGRFDPERWTAGQPRRETFIPFGAGPRKCIGDRFATIVTTLALATITTRWRLQPLPGARVRPTVSGPVLAPKGLRMRATARTTRPA